MVCPSYLADPSALIVIDTSVAINLLATRVSVPILEALSNRVVITEEVSFELKTQRRVGVDNSNEVLELVNAHRIEMVRLGDVGMQHFESLVVGPASETLDDGEAATIAYGIETDAVALIDERKANRICTQRFPQLHIGCTVSLLAHRSVRGVLGQERLSDAVYNALYHGRMRVLARDVEWVVSLIGPDRAADCHSLPKSVRVR